MSAESFVRRILSPLRDAAAMLNEGHASRDVRFYIHTNRSTWDIAKAEGVIEALTSAGVSVTADNCAVVSYDRVPPGARLATNSAKMALFARSVSDAEILFGTTADCIAAGSDSSTFSRSLGALTPLTVLHWRRL